MSRRQVAGSRVLVTGASSGIGAALARAFSRQRAHVLLTARREARLAALAEELRRDGGEIDLLAGDIADADHRSRLVEYARESLGGMDILVNNAGIGGSGPFREAPVGRLREIFDVNFFAAVELIRATLPMLEQGRQPIIVNVGSVLGHCAVPGKSEYCASKFALHGFSDALRAELAPFGVAVLLVSPSTTATEFFDHAQERSTEPASMARSAMRPDRVAAKTLAAIRSGRHEVILSGSGRLLVWADRLAPGLLGRLLARFG